MAKKTLVIGASANPERYSYLAAERLLGNGHPVELIGARRDTVFNQVIDVEKKAFVDVDTVTLYISAKYQPDYYDYIVKLAPKRVIFNPGTENAEFEEILTQQGIQVEEACTLVLLASGQY